MARDAQRAADFANIGPCPPAVPEPQPTRDLSRFSLPDGPSAGRGRTINWRAVVWLHQPREYRAGRAVTLGPDPCLVRVVVGKPHDLCPQAFLLAVEFADLHACAEVSVCNVNPRERNLRLEHG